MLTWVELENSEGKTREKEKKERKRRILIQETKGGKQSLSVFPQNDQDDLEKLKKRS